MSALRATGSTRRWRRIRVVVLDRDGWTCQHPGQIKARPGTWAALFAPDRWPRDEQGRALVCGAYADHADHVVPKGRPHYGTDALENLRGACAEHNIAKSNRLDETTPRDDSSGRTTGRWDW